MVAWGQAPAAHHAAKKDVDSCFVREVKTLPGTHEYAGDFIETIATDPSPVPGDRNAIWALTADLAGRVPAEERAMYISKSADGGKTWTPVARLGSEYFDAGIDEGLRNGLSVAPGATEFVITTQKGAFQVIPGPRAADAVVRYIDGPRVPHLRSRINIPKNEGDPVRAAAVKMTADGKTMIVGYGYFDMNPQIFSYHKDGDGSWVQDGPLPHLPTELDIFSMQFDDAKKAHPGALYVGTGDQAYRYDFHTQKWTLVEGVGPDSAIHAMSTVGGLHIAACWGVYEPLSEDSVGRVTNEDFFYHRDDDETGSNVRAYGIEVDPARPSRQVVTALTGVYISKDGGASWRRVNELPEGEYRTAHFNADGTVIVSGMPGTFLANPFSSSCGPRLKTRDE
jgi:hypothetical protein